MPNVYPGITREVRHYRLVGFTRNDIVPYPDTWPPFFNGGGSTPCDVLSGPCACGASHSLDEWIPMRFQEDFINDQKERSLRGGDELYQSQLIHIQNLGHQ